MNDKQKRIYVVLGMSRTGTSAIARSLKTLGIDLGGKFLPGNKINPKGFWEDIEIMYKINRGVSEAINHTYLDSDATDLKQLLADPTLAQYHANAINILQNRLANLEEWGFKDPRTLTLMPFWKSIFKKLSLEDRYVITVRNPISAAMSNSKFINCTVEEALLIWVRQMFAAIDETHGKKRVVVSYEAMLQNPRHELQRLHKGLALEKTPTEAEVNQYADEFLDKNLRHYTVDDASYKSHEAIKLYPFVVPLYDMLQRLATDQISFDDADFRAEWQRIKAAFRRDEALYCYLESMHKKVRTLEKTIARMKRSFLWKLIYPLRVIDEIVRQHKYKRKIKKRLSIYEAF